MNVFANAVVPLIPLCLSFDSFYGKLKNLGLVFQHQKIHTIFLTFSSKFPIVES